LKGVTQGGAASATMEGKLKPNNAPMISLLSCLLLMSGPFASAASAAMPCQLTADDFNSLADSPSKLTEQQADSLPDDTKATLCRTREFYHTVVQQNGNISRSEHYSPDFLTKKEFDIVSSAVNAFITREILDSVKQYKK